MHIQPIRIKTSRNEIFKKRWHAIQPIRIRLGYRFTVYRYHFRVHCSHAQTAHNYLMHAYVTSHTFKQHTHNQLVHASIFTHSKTPSYTYALRRMHSCMHTCIHTRIHAYYACTHSCMHTCILRIHTFMHACMHACILRIHTFMHAHMHTCIRAYHSRVYASAKHEGSE
jgi:hypothetical protein